MRHSCLVSTDDYGIPVMFFGAVSEEFYGMVGRVAMVSTLVEDKLLGLVWALDQKHTQDKRAGEMGAQLIKLCRRLLVQLPTIETQGSDLLERAQNALAARNVIVHSLWPNPGPETAFRHRPLLDRLRDPPHQWMDMAEIEISEIQQLIRTLAELVTELGDFQQRVHSARAGL
jgi:hypothetical protein